MRLIDADRLKDSVMFTCDLGGWIGETLLQIKKVAVKYIENAPTIDAVEVVRCGECKHMLAYGRCMEFADDGIRPSATDFCSYGERRKNDE